MKLEEKKSDHELSQVRELLLLRIEAIEEISKDGRPEKKNTCTG